MKKIVAMLLLLLFAVHLEPMRDYDHVAPWVEDDVESREEWLEAFGRCLGFDEDYRLQQEGVVDGDGNVVVPDRGLMDKIFRWLFRLDVDELLHDQ